MVGQSLWKNLKTLVTLDKEIEDLKLEIEKTQQILVKDKERIPLLESQVKEFEKTYLTEKKNISSIELDEKDLKDKENKQKKLLDKISNPKEYKAAEKELKSIILKTLDIDDLLVKSWHSLEEKKAKFENGKIEKDNQIKQLTEGSQVQSSLLSDLETKFKNLADKRNQVVKNVPNNWHEKYDTMRKKVSDPIVPVLGNSCSACYYSILRQDLVKLKKSGVLPCRNCYRFLYYDEEENKETI